MTEPPNGELQSIVDHMERDVNDEFDMYDDRMDLGYDEDE